MSSPKLDFIARQEAKGKRILLTLVLVNLAFFILKLIMSLVVGSFPALLDSIVMIVIVSSIYFGGETAKRIYIAVNVLNILSCIGSLAAAAGGDISGASVSFYVVTGFVVVLSVLSTLVLLFSGSVKEFMYKQQG